MSSLSGLRQPLEFLEQAPAGRILICLFAGLLSKVNLYAVILKPLISLPKQFILVSGV